MLYTSFVIFVLIGINILYHFLCYSFAKKELLTSDIEDNSFDIIKRIILKNASFSNPINSKQFVLNFTNTVISIAIILDMSESITNYIKINNYFLSIGCTILFSIIFFSLLSFIGLKTMMLVVKKKKIV